MTIADQIQLVRQNIQHIATNFGRDPQSICLMAVSKTHPYTAIQAAYESGITDFGESYISEAIEKVKASQQLPITWHFIGPIQSNKTKDIAHYFDWVHSVDRIKIAQRLAKQRPKSSPPLNICVQVNVFEEPQKKGVSPASLDELLTFISQQPNLILRGLMVIPPKRENFEAQLKQFKQVKTLFDTQKNNYQTMDTLSMGMSNDLKAAIVAGSNMVRVGTDIFGPRTQ